MTERRNPRVKNKKVGVFLNQEDDVSVVTLRGAVVMENMKWLNEQEYDYINPRMVQDALKKAGNTVRVEINSGGGDVYAGIEIYNILKTSNKDITTVITGRASSSASIIAQAGRKRLIFDNSQILSHRAWTFAFGNCMDFLDMAEELERVDANLRTVYMKNYKGTEKQLIDLMNEDRHMNAQEALEWGFVDEVIESYDEDEETTSNAELEPEILSEEQLEQLVAKISERISAKEEKEPENKEPEKVKNLFHKFKEEK